MQAVFDISQILTNQKPSVRVRQVGFTPIEAGWRAIIVKATSQEDARATELTSFEPALYSTISGPETRDP